MASLNFVNTSISSHCVLDLKQKVKISGLIEKVKMSIAIFIIAKNTLGYFNTNSSKLMTKIGTGKFAVVQSSSEHHMTASVFTTFLLQLLGRT